MSRLDRSVSAVAARQHGVFTTRQLQDATKSRIEVRTRSGRWRRVHRGVFVLEGSPDTWEQRVWIRLLEAGPGAVVGLQSAITLHTGRRGRTDDPIHIVQPKSAVSGDNPGRARRTSWLPDRHVTTVRGFPVTTYERTLFDMAAEVAPTRRNHNQPYMNEDRVGRLLDDAIVAGRVSVKSMWRVHHDLAGRGRGGTRVMRKLLEQRGPGFVATESELEDRFVAMLQEYGLPEARRQVQLGSNDEWLGRVDFCFDEAQLIVEVDGTRFHSQKAVVQRDHRRDLAMSAQGWQVLRIDWWQLTEEAATVAAQIRQVIAHRLAVANQASTPV